MNQLQFLAERDGFYGIYYKNPTPCNVAMIAMVGDSCDDYLAKKCVQWLHSLGLNVMTMSPDAKDYSCHNLPLERFQKACEFLKREQNKKIGIVGASTTGMMALLAASYFPDITMTIAISPSDFVMEGFYQENGIERPGNHESTASFDGKPLPFLPFAYRHPEYNEKIKEEAKNGKNMVASRDMFDLSERLHPVQEEERIKVERIHGTIILLGAEDDCLWDTCKYIRRMEKVLQEKPHTSQLYPLIYEHGTHFLFPESMMKKIIPFSTTLLPRIAFKAGRDYSKQCKQSRLDVDQKVRKAISEWIQA